MPRIGPYELHAIETGRFALDGGAMFGIVPKPLWEKKIAADDRNRIPLAMRGLLLEGDGRLVLIDNGLGDTYDARFSEIYAVETAHSELHRSLHAAGVEAADVTDVVLTHLHFDHCGGSTTRRDGRLALTFPNATHYVQKDHWVWARSPNAREKGSFLAENLDPLAESGRLKLLDGDGEVLPGVRVMTVDGHTEAQQLVKISGPEGTLVFAADLLPTTAHVRLPWVMAYDVRPLVTLQEKAAFLAAALEEEWQLFFEHDPAVAVAGLQKTERGITIAEPRSLASLF